MRKNYPKGVPVDTHEEEWPSYFEVPIPCSQNPADPRYWNELDRQVRLRFLLPDRAKEQRCEALKKLKAATEARHKNKRFKPNPETFDKVASDPEILRHKTPLQDRRRARRARRRATQQEARQDLNELNTDCFRQAGLNDQNSADTPFDPNFARELERRYPEWYH